MIFIWDGLKSWYATYISMDGLLFCSNLFNTRDIPKRENPSCFQLCMYIMHATLNRFAKQIAVLQMTFLTFRCYKDRARKGLDICKAHFQSCLFFFSRYFHDGLQTVEHFGTYIEDLVSKLSVIRQSQFEEKRDLEEVRNMLKTSPGFNKTVNFSSSKNFIFLQFSLKCTIELREVHSRSIYEYNHSKGEGNAGSIYYNYGFLQSWGF